MSRWSLLLSCTTSTTLASFKPGCESILQGFSCVLPAVVWRQAGFSPVFHVWLTGPAGPHVISVKWDTLLSRAASFSVTWVNIFGSNSQSISDWCFSSCMKLFHSWDGDHVFSDGHCFINVTLPPIIHECVSFITPFVSGAGGWQDFALWDTARTLWRWCKWWKRWAVLEPFVRTLYSAADTLNLNHLQIFNQLASIATVSILSPPAGEAMGERRTWTRERLHKYNYNTT